MSTTDIIGYIGIVFVLIAFSMNDIIKLRVYNVISCVIFIAYAILLNAKPMIILNSLIIIINIYFLIKHKQKEA